MAHSESPSRQGTSGGTNGGVLRAQLAIEPHSDSSCAVVNAGADAQDVTHHLKGRSTERDEFDTSCGECHTELAFGPDTDRENTYLTTTVSTRCICPVFEAHDCIPRIKAVRDGSIIVVLLLPRRDVLRTVISDLRAVGATVSVDWLVDGSDTTSTTEIDTNTITEKQHEAMEKAREIGYYETPRNADLGDVAEALDISESAASQRLNGAETKLVEAFLEEG